MNKFDLNDIVKAHGSLCEEIFEPYRNVININEMEYKYNSQYWSESERLKHYESEYFAFLNRTGSSGFKNDS